MSLSPLEQQSLEMFGRRDPVLDLLLKDSLLNHQLTPKQVDDVGARLLTFLTKLLKPEYVIEIGTYFGYSTLHIANGMPDNGIIETIECDPKIAELARHNFQSMKCDNKIKVIEMDSKKYLKNIAVESVDMIFIDGNKDEYLEYLKLSVPILRRGGVLITDDAFADGNYADENDNAQRSGEDTINQYNKVLARSALFYSSLVGTKNGMLLSIKL